MADLVETLHPERALIEGACLDLKKGLEQNKAHARTVVTALQKATKRHESVIFTLSVMETGLTHLRENAPVVSLEEFRKMTELADLNRTFDKDLTQEIRTLTAQKTAVFATIKTIESQLQLLSAKLSCFGKVLQWKPA